MSDAFISKNFPFNDEGELCPLLNDGQFLVDVYTISGNRPSIKTFCKKIKWPMKPKVGISVGEEPLKVATNKSVLKNVGRTLATIGAPLPTALLDGYFINEQVKEGKGTAEIASNPLNWLGLATMSTLSDISGVSKPGKLNAALRLGLNPAAIRGISRFAGLPGLAVSTAMTAYDQYKKYQNEEGFIYNLFNKEEK